MSEIDISESSILEKYPGLLEILLTDHSSGKNIIWATKYYWKHGKGYRESEQIKRELITGRNSLIIKPRIKKSLIDQKRRSKENAEVFTPAWLCNKQNNSIDDIWFGYSNSFNTEIEKGWNTNSRVIFKNDKKWKEYIDLERMEIACGEAPYLTSRYDVVDGKYIEPFDRIGLLDRKLRVICEYAENNEEWLKEVEIAYKRIYGYDYQGDNVLLARENLLFTFVDFYIKKFEREPKEEEVLSIAKIITWNIWQMDGMRYVIPLSCHNELFRQLSLFSDEDLEQEFCKGCMSNNTQEHNGIYCKIKDWRINKLIRFLDLIK